MCSYLSGFCVTSWKYLHVCAGAYFDIYFSSILTDIKRVLIQQTTDNSSVPNPIEKSMRDI
jgi:hypothetical protein